MTGKIISSFFSLSLWYHYLHPARIYSQYSDGLDGQVSIFDSQQEQEIFLYSITSRLALGLIQPPVQRVLGALSPEIKQLVYEAVHLPPSSAEVKNGGAIPPLPIHLYGVVLN
jgi:hypothetical protein